MATVLGLNSGSSFDGIDVVVIEIEEGADGLPVRPVFKAGKSFDWPERVAARVLAAFENEVSIFEMCRLNYLAGAVFAECARTMMREQGLKPGDVEVIGYDGQTIYQEPPIHADLDKVAKGEDPSGIIRDPAAAKHVELPDVMRKYNVEGVPLADYDKHPLLKERLAGFRHHYGQPVEVRRAFEKAMGLPA